MVKRSATIRIRRTRNMGMINLIFSCGHCRSTGIGYRCALVVGVVGFQEMALLQAIGLPCTDQANISFVWRVLQSIASCTILRGGGLGMGSRARYLRLVLSFTSGSFV